MSKFSKFGKAYRKTAIMALQKLVGIDSHYDPDSATKDKPYGAGVDKAFDYILKLSKEYGFKARKVLNRVVEIEVGKEGPLVGVYCHTDVVPATGKWTTPPFKAQINNENKLIGRGATDDKGPLIASLFAIKALVDNDLLDGFRVKFAIGGDEERGSSCMESYFKEGKGEKCVYGFTPDCDFPLIYAEKGVDHLSATRVMDLSPVIAISGGSAVNAVCDSCLVTLAPDKGFVTYLKENKIDCDISESDALLIVTFKGKSAHGSTPEKGKNAGVIALKSIADYYKKADLKAIADALSTGDGSSFGGNKVSRELGPNTFNYGIFNYDGHVLKFTIDFRYGEETDAKATEEALSKATGSTVNLLTTSPVLIFDKKGPHVSALMKVYRSEYRKIFAKPLAIGGNTYAKHVPNCIGFGPCQPGEDGNMHAPDEYIDLDEFTKLIGVYARAIVELGKAAKKA